MALGGIVGTRGSPSLSTRLWLPSAQMVYSSRRFHIDKFLTGSCFLFGGYTVLLSVEGSTRVGIFILDLSPFKRKPWVAPAESALCCHLVSDVLTTRLSQRWGRLVAQHVRASWESI